MNEKKVTIITVACLVFIVLAGGSAIWYLQFSVLAEKEMERDRVKAALAEANKKVAQIPKIRKDIEENLKPKLVELVKRIPGLDREEYDRFANLLDSFRRRAGVSVTRGSWAQAQKPQPVAGRPQPKPQPNSVHKVQYDLAVTGNFYQLLRFVNLLEEEMRFINVETFAIARGSESKEGALRREMKLTLYSYTYRPPDQTPPITIEEERKGRSTEIPE